MNVPHKVNFLDFNKFLGEWDIEHKVMHYIRTDISRPGLVKLLMLELFCTIVLKMGINCTPNLAEGEYNTRSQILKGSNLKAPTQIIDMFLETFQYYGDEIYHELLIIIG